MVKPTIVCLLALTAAFILPQEACAYSKPAATCPCHVPFAAGAIAFNWVALDFRPINGLGHNRIIRDPAVQQQVVELLNA